MRACVRASAYKLPYFHGTVYEYYATGEHPNTVISNSLKSVVTILQIVPEMSSFWFGGIIDTVFELGA